jgi:small subunit ribosomal protein S5
MMAISFLGRGTAVRAILVHTSTSDAAVRLFGSQKFRPRRRPSKSYRPIIARAKKYRDSSPGNDHKFVNLGEVKNPKNKLDEEFGPLAGDVIREVQNERARRLGNHQLPAADDDVEEDLRGIDYYLAEEGSIEDLVGERRALKIDLNSEEEREEYMQELAKMVEEGTLLDMGLDQARLQKQKHMRDEKEMAEIENEDVIDEDEEYDPETFLDPNQLAHGDWSEMLIQVDRNVKLWRGGRLESYRALVIGGNLNGCGGFGVGKSVEPLDAVSKASRICKRNIFFVERYQGNGLTRDLVGKQNNCKLVIRATDNGLRGNELVREILKRFGITNGSAKAYGRRSPYNVVLAAFKALQTHESLEEIAMKRGKRLVSLDRAMRLQI